MKLQDYGAVTDQKADSFFKQLLDWSRGKLTFADNFDCKIIPAYLGTAETIVQHSLGRIPQGIIEVASYPHGTAGISFTQSPTDKQLYMRRGTAGNCFLLIF